MTVSADAYTAIRRVVLDRIEEKKLDPAKDAAKVRDLVVEAVEQYQRTAHAGGAMALANPGVMVARVIQASRSSGPSRSCLLAPISRDLHRR